MIITLRNIYDSLFKYSVLICFFVFISSVNAFAETSRESIKALKKLESRCELPISLSEYRNALAETKFEVELYMDNRIAKKERQLSKTISNALSLYMYAEELWGINISGGHRGDFLAIKKSNNPNNHPSFNVWASAGEKYIILYPEDRKSISDGGVMLNEDGIDAHVAISHIWNRASKKVEEAMVLLARKNK